MELDLAGKRAVVTGSTRGIGRGIARALVADGASLLVCGTGSNVDPTVRDLAASAAPHAVVRGVVANLAGTDGVDAIGAAVDEHLGGIDVLVNCAGGEPFGSLDDFDEDEWRAAVDLKLWGYVKMTKFAFDRMRAQGSRGSVVNITGSGGTIPQAWYPAGAIVCGALHAFTRAVAHQGAAFGVRVNAVSPHYIETERLEAGFTAPARAGVPTIEEMRSAVGARRMGRPSEVATLVAFLASDRAAYISGAIVSVDGGTVGLMAVHDVDWGEVSQPDKLNHGGAHS